MKKRKVKAGTEMQEILEIVNFIKDRMATSEDLEMTRKDMNERFFEINGRLVSIEQDLKEIKRRLTALEDQFDRFGEKNKEEIEELWKHIAAIEKRLKIQR